MGKIIICVICALILIIAGGCVGVRIYFRKPVSAFFSASEKAFEIPGLSDNFVPQGLHYDKNEDIFVMSAYSSAKGAASALFLIKAETGEHIKRVDLKDKDGGNLCWHVGGVAVFGNYLYIAGSEKKCLAVFDYSEVLACENGGAVKKIANFSLKKADNDYIDPAFVTVEGNRMIVGEFCSEKRFPTLASHKMNNSVGEKHGAFAVEFPLSEAEEFGINPTPVKAFSIRDKAQGICFNGERMLLSTSLNFNYSYVYEYSEKATVQMGNAEIIGCNLPVYALDSASLKHVYKLPPMAEEPAFRSGRFYVLFESACNKYLIGKIASAIWSYATDLEQMR